MPGFLAAVLLAVSAAGAAPAQGASVPAPGHHLVVNPDWAALPTGDQLADAYPRAARAAGVGGLAKVQCNVRVDGGLERCVILIEDPPGWGFGAATLSVAEAYFRMRPQTVDGVPVEGGKVIIPIKWQLDPSAPKPAAPLPTVAEAQARDPEALALARKIAERTDDFDWAAAQISSSYQSWIYPLFDRQDPLRSAAFLEAFRTSLDDYSAERRDRVAAALVFQFSREELKDIEAFMETRSGDAFAHGFPFALARSYNSSGELLGAFVDAWRTRYCAKVACDDRDLNGFTTLSGYYAGQNPPPAPEANPKPAGQKTR